MTAPRAALLMAASLAAATVARLTLADPQSAAAPRQVRGPATGAVNGEAMARPAPAGPRPDTSAILAAHGGSRLRLLLAWLAGADDAALAGMAVELEKEKSGETLSIRLLMARWAEVNPAALLAWADRQRGGAAGFHGQNAIEAWARVDFDKAWAACAERPQARGSAMLGLTAVDPAKSLALLRADPALLDDIGVTRLSELFARLAGHDPAGAASLLEGASAARLASCSSGVALAWMRRDPAAAIAWLGTLPATVRGDMAREAGEWLARHAPEQIPALLESLPAGRARTGIAAAAFEHLARRDVAAARAQLDAMPEGPGRQYCRALLLQQLVRTGDDTAALALAGQIGWSVSSDWAPDSWRAKTDGSSQGNSSGIPPPLADAPRELLARIAARDPRQAADILLANYRLGIGPEKLLAKAAAANPAGLASAILERRDEACASGCLSSVISTWAIKEPSAAVAWINAAEPQGVDRARMEFALYSSWGLSDPEAMLRWAATRSVETNTEAWAFLAHSRASYAASRADEFFAAAPTLQAVSQLLQNLSSAQQQEVLRKMPDHLSIGNSQAMTNWLNQKPDEASAWVSGLPPGERRHSVTAPLVHWLLSTADYEAAFQWSTTLPAEQRASLLQQSASAWSRSDPAAAASAIRAAGLPEQEAAALLQSIPPVHQP